MFLGLASFFGRSRIRRPTFVTCVHDSPQRGYQLWPRRAQLVLMMKGKFAQYFLAFRSKRQKDFATVILRTRALDKSSVLKAVHEFHGAVMADLHALRQFADARPNAGRHALDRQQELIL